MLVFLVLLGILCLYRLSCPLFPKGKPADGAPFYRDYLSVDKTNSVKGIFILLVVFNHLLGYLTLPPGILNKSFEYIIYTIGQSMVAPFLFYSGYGILYSIEKKGQAYVKGIPVRRFLRVLLHFDIAVLLFAGVDTLISNPFTVKQFLLALTGWDSVGNSNWYIFDILCLYLITFLAFSVFRKKRLYALLLTAALCVGMMILLRQFKKIWWYDTLPCYVLGMAFYYLREPLEKRLFAGRWRYYPVLLPLLGAAGALMLFCHSAVLTILRHLLFTAALVLLTMKVSVHNKILAFLGRHLFGIYVLQRIPMLVLPAVGVTNPYLYAALSLCVSIAIAVPFDLLLGKLDGVLFGDKKKKPLSA